MKNLLSLVILASCLAAPASSQGGDGEPQTLRILTFNVWHGLRSGESKCRFPGEDRERGDRRLDWQIEEIKRLDPDVLLLQEVNRIAPQARRYAEALGYDVIYKATGCGVHIWPIKIPSNMNEGLAILARPELGLVRVGSRRLSGDARCTPSIGFQTKESRYVLLGEITVSGRPVLLATTHLSAPAYTPPDFAATLDGLVEEGKLTVEQRAEILEVRDRKVDRNTREAEGALSEIDRHRKALAAGRPWPAVLGGDFNAMPGAPSVSAVQAAGFEIVGTGPEFLTWDPVANHVNNEIGARRYDSLPTFDVHEIKEQLAYRNTTPRQIDWLFVDGGLEPVSAEMVLGHDKDGVLPSDHFGILVEVRIDGSED
jgi:endonuclease/exonuclease/phosphatase family metal-dependent hydrolase